MFITIATEARRARHRSHTADCDCACLHTAHSSCLPLCAARPIGDSAVRSMAPKDKQPREPSIERTTEYEEFLEELAKYHEKRGWALRLRFVAEAAGTDRDS